jgi:ABC-type nitrate/sulfonate/bicarbonate transport system substrate-binding protein
MNLSRSAVLTGAGATVVAARSKPADALAASAEIPVGGAANESSGTVLYANDLGFFQQAADLNGKTIATRDLANMSYLGALT